MFAQRKLKKLSKVVVLAMDWAAAEYKYLEEFKQELKTVEAEKDLSTELTELRKASKLLKYLSRAEQRAYRFEARVKNKIDVILEEFIDEQISVELITGFRDIASELDIEHDLLVKLSSFYDGVLEKKLNKAEAEARLEEELRQKHPEEAAKIHQAFLVLIYQLQQQIETAENWIRGLEVTLNKARELLQKIPEEGREHLINEGMAILKKYGFPVDAFPEEARFMAQHLLDLEEMAEAAGQNAWFLFKYGLPAVKELINEKTWPELVKFVETNKQIVGHTLYAKQPLTFWMTPEGKFGFKRVKFPKTGSETILLGGPLIGKVIIRIVNDKAFQSWKKALEAEQTWANLGFDYIPIEPILKKNGKWRAYKTKQGLWRVSTKVLGSSLKEFLSDNKNNKYRKELMKMELDIITGLDSLGITHGHLHRYNFCIERHDGKIRLYVIDFDQAVSPGI